MNYKGFLLIEVLLSITLAIIVITFAYGASIQSEQYTYSILNYNKASNLSKEGIEAVINARESSFTQFTDGTYGVYQDGTKWFLSPSPNVIDTLFTRTINVTSVDTNTKSLASTVTWKNPYSNTNSSITYNAYLTNWQTSSGNNNCTNQASKLLFNKSQVALTPNKKDIINLQIKNNTPNCDLQIKSISVSWNKPGNTIEGISINGGVVWNTLGIGTPAGSQNSGTLLDINDFTILGNNNFYPINYLRFGSRVDGVTLTILFNFTDGTTATEIFSI